MWMLLPYPINAKLSHSCDLVLHTLTMGLNFLYNIIYFSSHHTNLTHCPPLWVLSIHFSTSSLHTPAPRTTRQVEGRQMFTCANSRLFKEEYWQPRRTNTDPFFLHPDPILKWCAIVTHQSYLGLPNLLSILQPSAPHNWWIYGIIMLVISSNVQRQIYFSWSYATPFLLRRRAKWSLT